MFIVKKSDYIMPFKEMRTLEKKKYIELEPKYKAEAAENFFHLGLMYSTGHFGKPDPVTAHSLFNLAVITGNEVAKEYRLQMAAELNSAQISQAQRLARNWMQEA